MDGFTYWTRQDRVARTRIMADSFPSATVSGNLSDPERSIFAPRAGKGEG